MMYGPKRWRAGAALAVSAVVLTACATGSSPERSPFDRSGAGTSETIQLTVQNDDFRDATVYVYWSGVRARAGSVTGKTTQTFTMPWRGEYVQLRVDFLGSRSEYRTEVVPVDRGDHLNFVIMSAYGR